MSKIKETSTNFENKKILLGECDEIYAASLIGGAMDTYYMLQIINRKNAFRRIEKKYTLYNRTHAYSGVT